MTFKYYKPTLLVIVIIFLSGLISWVLDLWVKPFFISYPVIAEHFEAPTTIAALTGLFALYDNFLWKIPFFGFLVDVPNISGRYKGCIRYIREDKNKEKSCFIEVTQTASKVKVLSYFSDGANESTSSSSLVEDIKRGEDGFYEIYMFYQNGGTKLTGSLPIHEGTNKLRFLPGKDRRQNKLIGHYFTNRQPQTRGEIEVKFISKTLNGKF